MATTPPGDYAQISPLCDRRMAPVAAHAKSGASVQAESPALLWLFKTTLQARSLWDS